MSEVSLEVPKSKPEAVPKENSNAMSSRIEALTIQEDAKEGEAEDEEGLPIFPYERLKVTSTDLVTGIDVTKREVIKYNVPFYIDFIIIIFFCKISKMHWSMADLSVFGRISREIWHDKGCFL